jgi:ABC-type sugar transport system permease subunit
MAPLVILLFGLIGYPLGVAVRVSLRDAVGRATRGYVGLENYARLWQGDAYREMLLLTAKFVAFSWRAVPARAAHRAPAGPRRAGGGS